MTIIEIELDDDHTLDGKARAFHDPVLYDMLKDIRKAIRKQRGIHIYTGIAPISNNPLIFIEGDDMADFNIHDFLNEHPLYKEKVFTVVIKEITIYKEKPKPKQRFL